MENGELMAYDVTANGSWGTVGGCAQVIWTLVNFYKNNADPLLASELPYVGMPSLILADFFFLKKLVIGKEERLHLLLHSLGNVHSQCWAKL